MKKSIIKIRSTSASALAQASRVCPIAPVPTIPKFIKLPPARSCCHMLSFYAGRLVRLQKNTRRHQNEMPARISGLRPIFFG